MPNLNYNTVPADVQPGRYNDGGFPTTDADGEPVHQQQTKKRAKGPVRHTCSECQEKFWNDKTYGDHMSKEHSIKAFPCGRGSCPAAFSRPDPLKDHVCKKENSLSSATAYSSGSSSPTTSPPPAKRARRNRVNIHTASQTGSPKIQNPTRIAKQPKSGIARQTGPEMAPTRRNPSRDGSRSSRTSFAEVYTSPTATRSREDRDIYKKRIRDLEEREDKRDAECHELRGKCNEMEKKIRALERELFSAREQMESTNQRRGI
ncbi:hypothetical protein TWF281_001310 [Arthrobotrys megalospora]